MIATMKNVNGHTTVSPTTTTPAMKSSAFSSRDEGSGGYFRAVRVTDLVPPLFTV